MESDRLNKWLTFGANVGVLIGIILLIVELGQNQEMMRAQTRYDMAMGLVGLQTLLAENEQLADIVSRGVAGEELSPTEELRRLSFTIARMRYWEDVHFILVGNAGSKCAHTKGEGTKCLAKVKIRHMPRG